MSCLFSPTTARPDNIGISHILASDDDVTQHWITGLTIDEFDDTLQQIDKEYTAIRVERRRNINKDREVVDDFIAKTRREQQKLMYMQQNVCLGHPKVIKRQKKKIERMEKFSKLMQYQHAIDREIEAVNKSIDNSLPETFAVFHKIKVRLDTTGKDPDAEQKAGWTGSTRDTRLQAS